MTRSKHARNFVILEKLSPDLEPPAQSGGELCKSRSTARSRPREIFHRPMPYHTWTGARSPFLKEAYFVAQKTGLSVSLLCCMCTFHFVWLNNK